MRTHSLAFEPFPHALQHGRLSLFWALAGALAIPGVLPYAFALHPSLLARIPVPLPVFFALQLIQGFVLLLLLSWIGLRLGQGNGLDSPLARAFVYRAPIAAPLRTLAAACIAGGVTGLAIMVLDRVFEPFMPPAPLPAHGYPELWKRLLASFYGGITEELLCRLFLMSLLVWLLRKLSARKEATPAGWMIRTGIVGAAVVFGLGHLPAAAGVWPLSFVVVARTMLLNVLGGIPFGFLYWRRGLEHAMAAHFCADLVLHGIGGS
ncbi:hypothetical protein AB595_01350 [Massilia sp. WF1]|uniref:CPBP family intramembrane glutamic endopeptidase n=1 Tax=unclassified Massilia TaxID=2609279 RepID=UPI00064A6EB3|nr:MULTISPECIES: CPBP family intramembrane glutamic endopeptidase [unclassified Massilia]ALK98920.1 hypothetical protein AM586_24705 [Massilia sp. WG5]KLU38532.1 hypothetical protein AB595_01350 [Massilia sp. WF1]